MAASFVSPENFLSLAPDGGGTNESPLAAHTGLAGALFAPRRPATTHTAAGSGGSPQSPTWNAREIPVVPERRSSRCQRSVIKMDRTTIFRSDALTADEHIGDDFHSVGIKIGRGVPRRKHDPSIIQLSVQRKLELDFNEAELLVAVFPLIRLTLPNQRSPREPRRPAIRMTFA